MMSFFDAALGAVARITSPPQGEASPGAVGPYPVSMPLGDLAPEPPRPGTGPAAPVKRMTEAEMSGTASQMFKALSAGNVDESGALGSLSSVPPEDMARFEALYAKQNPGRTLRGDLGGGALSEGEQARADAYLAGDRVAAEKAAFHEALEGGFLGLGTDDAELRKTLERVSHLPPGEKQQFIEEMGDGDKIAKLIGGDQSGSEEALSLAVLDEVLAGDDAEAAQARARAVGIRADVALNGGMANQAGDYLGDLFGLDRKTARGLVGHVATVGEVMSGQAVAGLIADVATKDARTASLEKSLGELKTPAERALAKEAFRARAGVELDGELKDEYRGAKEAGMLAILEGDEEGAKVAQLRGAFAGPGTSKAQIFAAFEHVDEAQRGRIIARFNREAAADKATSSVLDRFFDNVNPFDDHSGRSFETLLDDGLTKGSLDHDKARMLIDKGAVSDEFAFNYALEGANFLGIGEDGEAMVKLTRGKSKTDLDKLEKRVLAMRAERKLDAPGEAPVSLQDLAAQVTGREGFELGQALKGEPRTVEERVARSRERYAYERGDGGESTLGYAAQMAVMGPLMGPIFLAQGIGPGEISRQMTDAYSGSGTVLDEQQRKIEEDFVAYQQSGGVAKEAAAASIAERSGFQKQNVSAYVEAKDTVTDTAASVAALAASMLVTVCSAGAASPALVAVLSALAGGGAKIAVNAMMQGQSYDNLERDLAMMAVEAATGGAMAKLSAAGKVGGAIGEKAMADAILRGGGGYATAGLQRGAVNGALAGVVNGGAGAALDEKTWNGDAAHALAIVIEQAGKSGAAGAAQGSANAAILSALKHGDNQTVMRMIANGGLAGVGGGVAGAAIDPATLSGEEQEILLRLARAAGEGGLSGMAEGGGEAREHALERARAAQRAGAGGGHAAPRLPPAVDEPAPASLPPLDDGLHHELRDFTPEEKQAMAANAVDNPGQIEPGFFLPPVEGPPVPLKPIDEDPAPRKLVDVPKEQWPSVEKDREKEQQLPGERERLAAEDEAAERARAARAAGEPVPAAAEPRTRADNPAVLEAHGEEIARRTQEAQGAIEGAYDDAARQRGERNLDILGKLGSVEDPELARQVLEQMQDLEVLPDGPEAEHGEKLLQKVVALDDGALARETFDTLGETADPAQRAKVIAALDDASTPEGQARLRQALAEAQGADGPVLHTVRPAGEVVPTPETGEAMGELMKGMPYGGEQPEVSKEIIDRYRQMLREGRPLKPIKVINGESIIDGHHRAIAQWLELGAVPYAIHETDPAFVPRPLGWDEIKTTPEWQRKVSLGDLAADVAYAAEHEGEMGC